MSIADFMDTFGYYIIVIIIGILLYVNRNNDIFKF